MLELAARTWDVVVVGGGHNGLTAAAYLARGGRSVLVLEQRDRLGGACTLERPFADERYAVSPCAYLVGLLHPIVIAELELEQRGYRTFPIDPTQWSPFPDGTSLTQWLDPVRTADSVAALSPKDVEGFVAYESLFARIRELLRRGPRGDTWLGDAPDRPALEELLAGDPEAREVVFEASVADVVERHVRDERLRSALHGQGIIGTFAGPREPGTAWVHAHHTLGLLGGWGYVEGGAGCVSACLGGAAVEAGAVLAIGTPVSAILPGEGVLLEGGERVRARVVVSNADPKRTLALVGASASTHFRARVEAWSSTSPVIKLNLALDRLPTFLAAPERPPHVYRAQVEVAGTIDETQAAVEAARAGVPAPAWCELYFQTAYDPSVAPPGAHSLSVFAQYVPYALAEGDWDRRRDRIADAVLDVIARRAPDVHDCIVARQVLAPPDVEARVGLSGGHIFQGEILPAQMWDGRFSPRTPIPGLYLCGAATHPGGSVMAINGRNAAFAVLGDLANGGTRERDS
jgi:phytoene dehydrogenase-like protein